MGSRTPNVDERLVRLQRFLERDPGNLSLLGELADIHLHAGRWHEARGWVEQALRAEPSDGASRYRLAVIERELGHPAEARTLLEALVADGVAEPPVLHELARAQAALGDWTAVQATLAEVDPAGLGTPLRDRVLWLLLRALHHAGEVAAAIALGERVLAQHPGAQESVDVVAAMATLYLDAERLDDAARLYDTHAASAADSAELQAVGAYVHLHRADPAAALQAAERSIRHQPGSGRAHLAAGLARSLEGDLAAAEAALTEATRTMPSHLGGWHALAWVQLLRNDVPGAERSFQHALEADRSFGDTYGGLAIVAASRGEREKADQLLRLGGKLDRLSMNVAVARTLLAHGKGLDDPAFIKQALLLFDSQAISSDQARRELFSRLLTRAARRSARASQ